MAEMLDESSHLESTTINVYRTAATVKGGRRFSFGALVVIGDRRGKVGYGYGKSNEVPAAIEKAQKAAKRSLIEIPRAGDTLNHEVQGKFLTTQVRLLPASPGTGVIAGNTVRAVLELAGFRDVLTKCYGSTNSMNVVKAVFDGLAQVRTREDIAALRGVEIETTDIEERVAKGKRFMPESSEATEKAKGPVNTMGQRNQRGGRGGRGGGGRGGPGGGRGGPGGGGQDRGASAPAPAPAGDTPAASPPAEGGAPAS